MRTSARLPSQVGGAVRISYDLKRESTKCLAIGSREPGQARAGSCINTKSVAIGAVVVVGAGLDLCLALQKEPKEGHKGNSIEFHWNGVELSELSRYFGGVEGVVLSRLARF